MRFVPFFISLGVAVRAPFVTSFRQHKSGVISRRHIEARISVPALNCLTRNLEAARRIACTDETLVGRRVHGALIGPWFVCSFA